MPTTRRPFFAMADLAENARRKAQGKTPGVISPLAMEAVQRIDALFEIERSINGQSAEQRGYIVSLRCGAILMQATSLSSEVGSSLHVRPLHAPIAAMKTDGTVSVAEGAK
jgi:hypothetical protein